MFKYTEIERGIIRTGPGRAELLNGLADDLGMADGERVSLFILSGLPVAPMRFRHTEDDSAHRRLVHAQRFPSALYDGRGTIVSANTGFWQLWPNLQEQDNLVRWMLTHPQARDELVDWETWAVSTLRVLKTRAVETGDARAIGLYRAMEHKVPDHIPIGKHSISGEVRYKLNSLGERIGMQISTYRPCEEVPSDRWLHVYAPVFRTELF